jgi:hypothetical protein
MLYNLLFQYHVLLLQLKLEVILNYNFHLFSLLLIFPSFDFHIFFLFLNRLYHNLSVLSESFELYENKFKLINNKISNKTNENDNKKKNIEEKNINDLDDMTKIYSNSITNIKMELPF